MVKVSEELWDGFDHVSVKTEKGLQVTRDITDFLKKRAELEQDYAKKLAALCKTAPGAGFLSKDTLVEKETKTLKAALLSIQEEGLKTSNHHQDFATKITNDVVKPLETFIKAKDVERKKVVADGQKRIKTLADSKSAADKAKEAYLKASKEAEAATEAHEKAQKDLNGAPDNKKFQEAEKRAQQKVGPLTEKAKTAEQAYQKAVEAANETITKTYGEHLPPILDSLQTLEEERYTTLKNVLQEYHTGQKAVPQGLDERCADIEKAIGNLDTDADLSEFVEAHKSAVTEPELVKFVPYKEPKDAPPAAEEKAVVHAETKHTETKSAPAPPAAKGEEDIFL